MPGAGRRPFFVLLLEGQATGTGDSFWRHRGTRHACVRLGALGKALEILRAAGVEEIVMVGPWHGPA